VLNLLAMILNPRCMGASGHSGSTGSRRIYRCNLCSTEVAQDSAKWRPTKRAQTAMAAHLDEHRAEYAEVLTLLAASPTVGCEWLQTHGHAVSTTGIKRAREAQEAMDAPVPVREALDHSACATVGRCVWRSDYNPCTEAV
jgi:hypothetical protein